MSKTLSESAAEILKASIANRKQDPMPATSAQANDLGGATPTDDYAEPGQSNDGGSASVGKQAAAAVKKSPVPGDRAAPQEPIPGKSAAPAAPKKASNPGAATFGDSVEHSEDEEVISEEEVAVEEETELSEEEIVEAKKQMMKGLVAKHKGTMKEDVDALFNGESLSEDFRVKATLIFESAVQSRVEKIVEDVLADNDKILEEAYDTIKTDLSEQVDTYLNYVVEQWMTENQVAIESGLRAELTEGFIDGLKTLFAEHYIEIPDEKLDVAEELASKVLELEESAADIQSKFDAVRKELNESKKNEAIRKACNGLTETQIAKLKSLAEGVEFTTDGDFDNKLAVIRENYFPTKKIVSEVKVAEETSETQPEVDTTGIMAHYVRSITKSLPK
jgi:hypothetical protein